MQCSGSQTLPAGGSSQNLHFKVTCKEGKRIVPSWKRGDFSKNTPWRAFSPRNPFADPRASRKEGGMIFLSLQVISPPAAGEKRGHVLLCCALLVLLRSAGVSGMDPTSSCCTRSQHSAISPSSLCSSIISGIVGGDGQPPAGERLLHGCGFDADGLGLFSGVAGISTSVTCIAVPVYLIMQLWSSYICVCVSVCR